ncbi:uncharacterized protein LOC129762546 [Toxorhynchites rutilus septentrionalis]|uniref:uncharacterized protein LOC129762546 n=1 Tax=Toxorhynchites rutilus septentrionalis TaxID=329112 RepID=UPI00247B146F|nr:uncharacterized protein LOC129762546 [Toxorhynchites rutilus septentrionalis]
MDVVIKNEPSHEACKPRDEHCETLYEQCEYLDEPCEPSNESPEEHVTDSCVLPAKSRTVCIVPGCSERYGRGVSFHTFPKKEDKHRWKAWVTNLRLKYEPIRTSRVCSSHFSIQNFISPTAKYLTDRIFLKRTAIPDINLPQPTSDPRKDEIAKGRAERVARRSELDYNLENTHKLICADTGDSPGRKIPNGMESEPCEANATITPTVPIKCRTVCIVPGCRERYGRGCSFHRFPKPEDKKRMQAWVTNLRLKYKPTLTSRVCSSHFSVQNFIPPFTHRVTDRKILKNTAVPDVNLPQPKSEPKKSKLAKIRAERVARRSQIDDNGRTAKCPST